MEPGLAKAPGHARLPRASCRAAGCPRCLQPAPGPGVFLNISVPVQIVFCVRTKPHDLTDLLVTHLADSALHPAGHHRATTRDREHVFHRHQERTLHRTLRRGDVAIQRISQLHDRLLAQLPRVAFQRLQRRADHDRGRIPGELVLGQKLTNHHLDELQQLLVVDHVGLVHVHNDVRHSHLARQEDVLARLRHRAIGSRHHQDRTVHLCGSRDHVLHVVRVARAVNVRIVTVRRLVFHMRRIDRYSSRLFFRCRINLVIGLRLSTKFLRQYRRYRRRQRRLTVVNVANRSHVHVGFRTLELALSHDCVS